MFEKINFVKNDEIKDLINEYEYLKNLYVNVSKEKEKNQNDFLKDKIVKNKKDGRIFSLKKDFIKDFNNYKNLVFIKTIELNRKTKEEEYIPLFITLTNPSEFHPFLCVNKDKKLYIKNDNFKFMNLTNAIDESYLNVNKIFREFYKRIKLRENKDMKFIKIIEPHKTLISHLHRILYVKRNTIPKVYKVFKKIKKKYKLKQCNIKRLKKASGSSYIIKYLLKNFEQKQLRQFDGYRKFHKIRIFTMSNLDLTTQLFKKLYNTNKEVIAEVRKEIKENKSEYKNIYEFFIKNTSIKEFVIENKNISVKLDKYNKEKRFLILKETVKKTSLRKIREKIYKSEYLDENKLLENKFNFENKNINRKNYFKKIKKIEVGKNKGLYRVKHIFFNTYTEKEIKYNTTTEFKIFDTVVNKEIYNKKDYEFLKVSLLKAS